MRRRPIISAIFVLLTLSLIGSAILFFSDRGSKTTDPIIGVWEAQESPDALAKNIQQALGNKDEQLGEAFGKSEDRHKLLFQSRFEFRTDGTVTETIILGKDQINVDGTWQLLNREGDQARYKIVMGKLQKETEWQVTFAEGKATIVARREVREINTTLVKVN